MVWGKKLSLVLFQIFFNGGFKTIYNHRIFRLNKDIKWTLPPNQAVAPWVGALSPGFPYLSPLVVSKRNKEG